MLCSRWEGLEGASEPPHGRPQELSRSWPAAVGLLDCFVN
uniref:Uncharacterized protein n=1 Tax=Zea mays TaxID=4577 RepID=B6U3R9_MAIZE|nr:hypothetical protein [Zea mays]